MLARIPKRSTTILTNRRGRPWGKGFASSFSRAKKLAGLDELHFHDLRGTAATRFYTAGLSERVIAEIMGWEEEHVGKIIRRYVGRAADDARHHPPARKENNNLQNRQQNQAAAGRLSAPLGLCNGSCFPSFGRETQISLTSCLPKFLPFSIPKKASGALSRP